MGHCINLISLYPYPLPPPPAEELLFLLIPEDWLKLHSPLKTSIKFGFTPEEYGSTLKNFVKIKASPQKNSIVFYSTPEEILNFYNFPLENSILQLGQVGSKGGAVVRALASHQCSPGSTPGVNAICGLSLLLVLSLALRGFSLGTSVFPFPQKLTLPNSNSIWNAWTRLNEFIWTPMCFVGKQAIYNLIFFIFNSYSPSLSGLWVNSPWGRRANGLLTQRPSSSSTNQNAVLIIDH